MKNIFFFVGIFACASLSAQQPIIIPKKDFENKFRYYSYQKPNIKLPDSLMLNLNKGPQARLQSTLPDSTKVYSLPLDNMICVVPDMSQFNMPNAGNTKLPFIIPPELKNQLQYQPGKIPNATIPYNIIPQRKDTPAQ